MRATLPCCRLKVELQDVKRVHYVIWYQIEDGKCYELRSVKAATVIGVAQAIVDLKAKGHTIKRWERHTVDAPNEREQEALKAFLAIADL